MYVLKKFMNLININNYKIYCIFFRKVKKKSKYKYIPNILGEHILNNFSEKSWKIWLKYQTIIINENLLKTNCKNNRIFIKNKMLNFLLNF